MERANAQRGLGSSTPMDARPFERKMPGTSSREDITALPLSKELRTSPHLRPVIQENDATPRNFPLAGSTSPSSDPQATRAKPQRDLKTNKRAALESPLPRRKSSKKRKDDHVREEEIRAMSAHLPMSKPRGDSGLFRRDSRKLRGGSKKNLERPTSNVSLPLEDSVHSSMSAHSDCRNYRVSLLDLAAPRPILRYSLTTPYISTGMSHNNWNAPTRSDSRRSQKRPVPGKEVLKENRTIDALADDLDASELRKIMERDQRRRERKRMTEAERLQKKLERRAEKERRKELKAQEQAIAGADPSLGKRRETERPAVAGLGIESHDQSMPLPEASSKPPIPEKSQERLRRSNSDARSRPVENRFETPFEKPLPTAAKVSTYSPTGPSPPASPSRVESRADTVPSQPSSFLQSYTPSEPTPPSSAPQRGSETSTKRGGRWSSFFRRDPSRRKTSADRAKDARPAETSFANTSRDSMSRQVPPTHLYQPPSHSSSHSRPQFGTPVRTQSRFREDLPELPLSPPDSRLQSPEATSSSTRAVAARRGYKLPAVHTDVSGQRVGSPSDELASHGRTDSPASGRGSHLMSQSLASVDSEGSWLSGKPMNKLSSKARKYNSGGSLSGTRQPEDFSASNEELGLHDDEYSRRLTPQPGEGRRASELSASPLGHRASSSAIVPADDYDDDDDAGVDTDVELQSSPPRPRRDDDEHTVVHGGAGRQPTVVHRGMRVRSSEGLLKLYNESAPGSTYSSPPASPRKGEHVTSNGDGGAGESPSDEMETPETASVRRASSVKVGGGGGHARQISAGSAKLLDIPKRASQSGSRASTAEPSTPFLRDAPVAEQSRL